VLTGPLSPFFGPFFPCYTGQPGPFRPAAGRARTGKRAHKLRRPGPVFYPCLTGQASSGPGGAGPDGRGGPTGGSGWALAHPKLGPPGTPPVQPPSAEAPSPMMFQLLPDPSAITTPQVRLFACLFLAPWRLENWLLALRHCPPDRPDTSCWRRDARRQTSVAARLSAKRQLLETWLAELASW
jgi:hypothetical protein